MKINKFIAILPETDLDFLHFYTKEVSERQRLWDVCASLAQTQARSGRGCTSRSKAGRNTAVGTQLRIKTYLHYKK